MSASLFGIKLKPLTLQAATAVGASFTLALCLGTAGKWVLGFDGFDVLTASLSAAGGALAAVLGINIQAHGLRAVFLAALFAASLAVLGLVARAALV